MNIDYEDGEQESIHIEKEVWRQIQPDVDASVVPAISEIPISSTISVNTNRIVSDDSYPVTSTASVMTTTKLV